MLKATSDIIIRLGSIAGSITTVIALIILIRKHLKPLAKMLDQTSRYIERSQYTDLGMRTLLKDRLSMLSTLVIRRGWMTITDQQVLQDGLKAYRALDGNGPVEAKVSLALRADIRLDPEYQRALKEQDDESIKR